MMDSLLKRIENNRKAHTRWLAMILCLSMLVSLGTFAGFHKTAVAKTYTKEVLDCPFAQEGASPVAHVHNDDCYDGDTLVCTLPEREAHTHTEECFAEQRRLTCLLEENPGHQHSDACYAAREEITCGLEENPGHVHNGTCFNDSGVLICTMAEGDGAHTHTADCFTTVYDLICNIPEGEGAHTHTDECYTTERVQVCGQEELPVHVHGPECIRTVEWNEGEDESVVTDEPVESTVPEMPVSDPDADLESVEDWNREFENFELSGNWARDLILVAATQQGRGESPNNFEAFLNDAGDAWVRYGYTRYGAWYGVPYANEWSAMFVSFCLRYAGIPAENVPNNPTAAFMAESFQKGELFAGRDYVPAVGDLIFFDTVVDDDIVNIDHMGIVYHVDAEDGTINTVEGDRTNAVATFGYHLDDEQIVGYGILPQNPNYSPAEEENTEDELDGLIVMTTDEEQAEETTVTEEAAAPAADMPAQSWERTAGGIKVSVEAPEGAFPENTTIAVTPVNGNSLKDTVSDAVNGEVLEVQAVDITFFDAEEHEIEPAIPIRVSMTPAATEHAEEKTSVVHVDVAQQTAELIEQAAGTEFDNSEVVFDADAFTIYAIVYTYQVEYEYEVDGKTFTSSMPGAENMTLTQIVEGLGIVDETEIDTFVSKIKSIASTNEEVAIVTQNNEIRVLKDGEAKIVITMQDGAKFHIDVRAEGETSASNETATVSTKGDLYLPADAELKTEVLDEVKSENAIAAVQALEANAAENTEETAAELNAAAADPAVKVPSADSGEASTTNYQVFDISLDGVEPTDYKGFQVDLRLPENVLGKNFRLYHVHDGIAEELQLDLAAPDGETVLLESVSFVTPSFSYFVLSYTVDFEYTDPVTGETYQFHMPGDGTLLVSQLFAALHIREDVTQIVDVTFTDDTLLRAEQVEGDWLLTSLMPFDTTETLTIRFADGHELVLSVTDDQSQARGILADMIKTLTLSAGGNQVTYNVANDGTVTQSGNSNFNVKPGTNFDLQIAFQERPGDAEKQFTSSEMVFDLPNGLSFEGYDQTDVTLSFDGEEIHGNHIWVEGGKLHIDLNETDPNWKLVETSGSSHIEVDLHGQFGESSGEVNFTDKIKVDVNIDTTTNAKISKSGNYDSNRKAMHYTITVESDGATSDINLTDTLKSTNPVFQAIDPTTVTVTSNKHDPYSGARVSVADDGQKLTGTIASMENGERVTIDYYAPIDMTKVPSNGTIAANTMGNDVTMTATETPGSPDDNTAHVDQSNEIDFSSFYKNNNGVDHTIWEENGIKYKTVKWKITSNPEKLISLAGTKIKDKIAEGSQAIMDYSGPGITITVDKGGETEIREVPWSQLNLNNDSWEYTIPSDDGTYSYVIEYTTKVKITGLLDGVTVKNDSEGTNGEGHAETGVGPKEEEKFTTQKKLISYDNNEAIWQIDINVPSDGYETLKVADWVPNNYLFFDDLDTTYIQVDGLVDGETYSPWQPIYKDMYIENVQQNVLAGGEIVFSHDGGTNNGLKGTGSPRTVTVTLKTKIDSEWVAEGDPVNNKTWHQNEAKVTANGTEKTTSDGFNITPEGLSKENGGMRDIVMNDGTTRKLYKFILKLSGVDRTTDDPIVIKDYFDTSILEYLDPTATSDSVNSWQAVVFPGTDYYNFNSGTQFGIIDVSDLNDNGHQGVLLSIDKDNLAKMDNGHWFPVYKIEIYLVSKEAIANAALQHDGHLDMKNRAEWKTDDEVDFSYDYPGLNKQMTSFDSKTRTANFRLVINPDKATMNGGNNMTLIDAYLNDLSIDYETIRVVTDPAGMEVSYDATTTRPDDFDIANLKDQSMASNMSYLIFDIPDSTKITITYQAKLVGEGNLNIYNTALLNGHYKQIVDQWQHISGNASGGGSITKLRLMKYEKNHMENTLGGVTFGLWTATDYQNAGFTKDTTPEELLSSEHKPLKTFTTATAADAAADPTKKTKTGMVEIILDQSVDGTEIIRGQKYILRELTTPTGYASDNTEYQFTIPENGQPDYTQYYYMNDDVLNVKNTPHGGLKIIKSVRNATLTDEQKAHISFKVTKIKDANGDALVPVVPINFQVNGERVDTLTFDQFVNSNYLVSDSMEAGTYEVEEINTAIEGYDLIDASVRVDKNESQTATNLASVKAKVVLTNDDITNGTVHAVSFVNNYESVKLTVFKNDEKGNRLVGAKFKMTKDGADFAEFEITEENKDSGYLFTGLTAGDYVLTETEAPEGYVPITEPVKFTVAENGEGKLELTYNTPEAERQGYVAFAQTSRTANYVTVKNEKVPPETEVVLQKKWVDLEGNEITDEYKQETLTVDLMRRVYADPVFISANVGVNNGSIKQDKVVTADSNVTVQLRYPYGVQGGEINSNPALTFTDADGNELTITPTQVWNTAEADTDITYNYDLGAVSKDITIGGTTNANPTDVTLTISHTSTPMREEVALAGQTVTWDDSTDVAEHWSKQFEKLPLTYSEKGSDGMRHTYGYEYYIVEKNGVIPVEEVNNDGILGGTITIKNKKSKTEIEVEKIWKDEAGNVISGTIDEDSVQMEIYQVEHRTPDERDEYYTVEFWLGENDQGNLLASKTVAKGSNVKFTYQTNNLPTGLAAKVWYPTTSPGSNLNNNATSVLDDVHYEQVGQVYICEYTLVNVRDDTSVGVTIGSNVPDDYKYYKVDWPEAGKATEGTKYGDTITVLKSEDWKKKVGDLPLYAEKPDGSIVYYTYYVQEVPVEGYGMSYEPMIDLTTRSREVESGKIEVTNQQFYKETEISVEKKWKDQAGQDITDSSKLPDTVDIELYQVEWEENAQKPRYFDMNLYYDASATATTLHDTITVEKDKEITYTITAPYASIYNSVWAPGGNWYSKGDITDEMNKPLITTTGPNAAGMYTHTFTVKAVRSLNVGIATGANTSLEKVTVTATPDGESSMRSDGVLYGTYTLKGSEDWTKVIGELPQKAVVDGRRVAYTYYVVEKTKVPKFEVSYSPASDVEGQSMDVDNGTVSLTNTEVDEYVLTVNKTWFRNDGTMPIEKEGSIEFDVLQAETTVNAQYKVTFDYGQNAYTGKGYQEQSDIAGNSVVTVTMRKRTVNYNGTSISEAPTEPVLNSNDDIKYYDLDTGHDYAATSVKASLSEWTTIGSGMMDCYGTLRPYTDFEATVGITITGNTAIICCVAENDAVNNYYTVTWPQAEEAEAIDWENAPVYHTYTLSSADGWTKTIGLPKTGVDAGGNDVEYRYLVCEHAVEGYESTITGNTDDGIVFSQDSANVGIKNTKLPAGNLKITKNFLPETVSPHDGSKLVFKVYGPYENAAAVPALADLASVEPKVTVSYDQFTSGGYTVEDLVLGTYLVVESGHDATGANVLITDYHFVADGSTTTATANLTTDGETVPVILTNKYEEDKGAIVITKKVRFNKGAADTDEKKAAVNKTFKFEVKKDGVAIVGSPFEITVTDGSSNKIIIPNLLEGDYTIEEIESNGLVLERVTGGKSVVDNVITVHVTKRNNTEAAVTSDGKASFTNDLPTTTVDVTKTWLKEGVNYSGRLAEMFGAVTVNFDIVKVATDATDGAIAAAETAKNVFGENAVGSMTSDTWTATVSDLPVLGDNEKYVVREISVTDGKDQDITAKFTKTLADTTINNAPETTEVTVSKAWSPEIPQNTTATLSLYKGRSADTAETLVTTITLDGEEGDAEYISSTDHSAGKKQKTGAWEATFSELPKYGYDETDGVYTIAYVIKEDTLPEGYSVSYADGKNYAISDGTVTNNKMPGDLELNKTVSGEGANQENEFAFEIKLTAPNGGNLENSYTVEKGTTGVSPASSSAPVNLTWTMDDTKTPPIENTNKEGTISVTLKHNETVTVKNLPVGTKYSITETNYTSDGYTSDAMTTPQTGTIEGGTAQTASVSVNNVYGPKGSLKLQKLVTVDNAEATSADASLVDGDYTFTIQGPDGAEAVAATVTIKVDGGVATQYKLNNAADFTDLPNNNRFVVIPDLAPGDYVITETGDSLPNGMHLASIDGGKLTGEAGQEVNNADITNRTVTATVTTGDTTPTSGAAIVTYTNNKVTKGSLSLEKVVTAASGLTAPDGTYTFTVQKVTSDYNVADTTNAYEATVAITFQGNTPKSATVKIGSSAAEEVTLTDNKVILENLEPGWYKLSEASNTNGTELTGITVTNPDVTYNGNSVVNGVHFENDKPQYAILYVEADKAPANAQTTFTNTLALVSLKVIKVEKGNVENKLPDAEFQMTRKNSSGSYEVFENEMFAEDTKTGKKTGPFSVGSTGEITITNLFPGHYNLKETKAPDGYIIVTDGFEFTINIDGTVTVTGRTEDAYGNITYSDTNNLVTFKQKTDTASVIVTIENTPGTALPQTGGIGTTLFTALGGLMTASAGAVLTIKRKRKTA